MTVGDILKGLQGVPEQAEVLVVSSSSVEAGEPLATFRLDTQAAAHGTVLLLVT